MPGMTDAQRDAVVDTALDLDAYNIAYDMGWQIKYNTSNMNGSKVQPNQLSTCRCDGLVEYAYEYNDPHQWHIYCPEYLS